MSHKYTNQEVLQFLKDNPVMNISVVSASNKPISSVVLFAVDENFTFYFATKDTSYKSKALSANPNISLSVWEHNRMLVQADGVVKVIYDAYHTDIVEKITDSCCEVKDFWPPLLHIEKGDYIFYSIRPHWVRALDLSDKAISHENMPFQILIDKNA